MVAYKRKRSQSTKNVRVSKKARGPVAFPRSKRLPTLDRALYTKSIVVYSDFGRAVDPGLASIASYVYSLNGLYDPDITGVGGQPTGFDQYMALYAKYTVLKAKVTCQFMNTDTGYAQVAGCNVAGLSTTSNDPAVYLRNNNMGYKAVETYQSGNATGSFSFEVDIAQLANCNIWTDDAFSGLVSANPANQWYLIIWNGASDGASNPSSCLWQVKIEYLAAFREPINAANS